MTIFLSTIAFLGGVYVGARYQKFLRDFWYNIFPK